LADLLRRREVALENLESASEKIDPYIKTIREAAPKATDFHTHYIRDRNKKRWKKAYTIFKELFGFRSIIYAIPATFIIWLFSIDIKYGFYALTALIVFLLVWLAYYVLGIIVLHDMTDEGKKEYFHYYAYTNHRREYDIFAHYIAGGNNFRFKQVVELFKEWNKDIEAKDTIIKNLERDLKSTANDAINLPVDVQEESDYAISLAEKLLEKVERKGLGVLTFRNMKFFGQYAIYRLEGEELVLEYYSSSNQNTNIPTSINIKSKKCKSMSYIKILNSSYEWESDQNSTISFVAEVSGTIYVYTVIVDNQNKHALNKNTSSGKINIDRLANFVSAAFKLFEFDLNKGKRS
jgi:hypothetical protein